MGLLDRWREARGNVMRKEFDDVMARVRGANGPALHAFYNNLDQTIERLTDEYGLASAAGRKSLLREAQKAAHTMWDGGDWPSSLGLAISCLNVESKYVPGEDAAYVHRETEKVIRDAAAFFESKESK